MIKPMRLRIGLILLVTCLLPLNRMVLAQESALEADVTLALADNQSLWMGQQITVNMSLRTTGQLFSNILFNLPEVEGAFFLQTDTSTLKSSETVDGQSWQTITYPLTLFAQIPGQIQIPPITVRFESSRGFGTAAQSFELNTDTLSLDIQAPPGIAENDMVISTSGFKLDYQWQPVDGEARVGAAFTLSVTRSAENIAGMLFPPLPVYQTPGLASYPQAPEIKDQSDRGNLIATRKDRISWVAEAPGNYSIPEIRIQWFDPSSGQLERQTIPGLQLSISALENSSDTAAPGEAFSRRWFLAGLLLLLILSSLLWWRAPRQRLQAWREERTHSEAGTYKKLIKHCRANQSIASYQAYQVWIAHYDIAPDSLPATELNALTRELDLLQEAIVKSTAWQGRTLSKQLHTLRQQLRNHSSHGHPPLPGLNP